MTRVFSEDGNHIPVTVLKVVNCQVIAQRTEEKDGYTAVQLGAGEAKLKNVSAPMKGHFAKAKVEPKQKVAEFRVSKDAMLNVGDELSVEHFVKGQYVDATATSVGKGFQGGMKRHNFGGLRATHGVSISHRSHGSTGQCQDPGRVFKGKKMAGHMGDRQRTAHNLEVVAVDAEEGVILVQGCVPGSKGRFVLVKDAIKKLNQEGLPFPAGLKTTTAPAEEVKEEVAEAPVVEAAVEAPAVETPVVESDEVTDAQAKAEGFKEDKIVESEAQAIEQVIAETADAVDGEAK